MTTLDRFHPLANGKLDETDYEILLTREREYNESHKGPRVGDYIRRLDGKLARFSHDWGDALQTSLGGSWYLGNNGHVSFSGGLDPAIPIHYIAPTTETRAANFWFFSHNEPRAHNGVQGNITCRVYEELPR